MRLAEYEISFFGKTVAIAAWMLGVCYDFELNERWRAQVL